MDKLVQPRTVAHKAYWIQKPGR